jgi:hypothetical protein
MKNIKYFKQLFESFANDNKLKIVSFGENEFKEFQNYCTNNSMSNWDMLGRNASVFSKYIGKFGKFYIINDAFLVQCEGETPEDIVITNGADVNNARVEGFDAIGKIAKEIGCPEPLLRISLIVAKKIPEFSIDPDHNVESADAMTLLCDYFKKNPLKIYTLDNSPQLKSEVIKRTGIRDYGKIGRGLDNGLI